MVAKKILETGVLDLDPAEISKRAVKELGIP
jgi:hypothetical protein